ncbi:MarR family transcriptional regulator [Secundilactobacillus silagincola]|uniref:MarR family transcriptional regulator n=1 Tax=Secundilactobacillus silagincola TaxID=1714681 RepID=A0A1Z5J578_9LACO|nr:MarR family winged helix-turn-helix transcriptional regulator [Secundilactobacillus silagincola]GAX09177.1 MarR family transcriptional regulator [Secundilactobacillus silagincola]
MTLQTFPGDLAQSFSIIHRAFQRDTQPVYKQLNLNVTNAYILLLLEQQGEHSQNELAKRLVINKGQITREIKRLSELGYVSQTQSVDNRTTNVIKITEAGSQVVPKIVDIRNQWWQQRLDQSHVDVNAPFAETLQTVMRELIERDK